MATHILSRPATPGDAVAAGLVASIVYTIVAQAYVVATAGPQAFFVPFRQIAAVAAGPGALARARSPCEQFRGGSGLPRIREPC